MTDAPFRYTTSQAAERLGVSLGSIRRWADEGLLGHTRTPGGQRRFSEADLQEVTKKKPREDHR